MPHVFGERADQHRLRQTGGVVSVGSLSEFGVAPFIGPNPPPNPFDGQLWIDSSARLSSPVEGQPSYELRRWNANRLVWELVGYNVMTPAGPGHASGLVGDPGDTPHSPPWYWGDDSAFHPPTGGGGGAALEAASYVGDSKTISSQSTYSLFHYTKIPLLTGQPSWVEFRTTIDFPDGDFFITADANNPGILVVKMAGWYEVNAGLRWDAHSDSNTRAMGVVSISSTPGGGGGSLIGLQLTIHATGTGYNIGDIISASGGTLTAGGIPLTGTVATIGGGGSINTISIDPGTGIGYTSAPTINIAGGSGASITAALAPTITPGSVFGAPAFLTYGVMLIEDVRSGISSATAHVQQSASRLIYLSAGEALMLVGQQASGGNLATNGLYGFAGDSVASFHGECDAGKGNYITLFRVSDHAGGSFVCEWNPPE